MSHATLLASCVDQKGIVATLTQLLYDRGANILDADQHSDLEAGMFFQRIRFDLELATRSTSSCSPATCRSWPTTSSQRIVLARAVRLHLEDRVLVYGNKTVVFE